MDTSNTMNEPSSILAGKEAPIILDTRHASLQRSYTNLVSLIEQHRKLDRSISEPTSRYKTELCRPFEESGSCKYGDKCQFAHGYNELRNLARHPKYKTELCRTFHKIGFCPYGPRCHFVHNFEEARIHNSKVTCADQQQQLSIRQTQSHTSVVTSLETLIQPLGVNVNILDQLVPSQIVATVTPAPITSSPLVRTNSLNLTCSNYRQQNQTLNQSLRRSNSLGITYHQQHPTQIRPKPLNLSPTFSLSSTAESISPSSSLSQSPTNSMASFFNDESLSNLSNCTSFGFCQDLGLMSSRQSPSSFEELNSCASSPLSPGIESRLPVFNKISNIITDLKKLKM